MLKKVLIVLALAIAGLVIFISSKPNEFRVSRSASFAAAPEVVFAQVNNFHNWEAWSPWAKLDPNAKIAYEGPASGVGAKFSWAGNNQVGEGSETIIESVPSELIKIKLEFLKPFKGTNTAEFNFKPQNGGTDMTWSMYGPSNFISKAMSLFMDCDKMVGAQFEQGLANLRSVVENK